MHEFEYLAPGSLTEAVSLARAGGGGGARFLAGGTDLVLAMERGHAHGAAVPSRVIDLKRIAGLDRIEPKPGGGVRIGALAPMAAISAHPDLRRRFAALAAGAGFVGGPAIRNRATLGGNICNASPAADTSPGLLVCGAEVEIAGPEGSRTIPLAAIWIAPRKISLAPGEAVVAVHLPAPAPRTGTAFQRVTRTAMDIALANAAALVTLDGKGRIARACLTLGAVAPTVIAVPAIEKVLSGRAPDEAAWREAAALAVAAAKPITDVRASAEYRSEMAGVLTARALQAAAEAAARAGGAA